MSWLGGEGGRSRGLVDRPHEEGLEAGGVGGKDMFCLARVQNTCGQSTGVRLEEDAMWWVWWMGRPRRAGSILTHFCYSHTPHPPPKWQPLFCSRVKWNCLAC